MRIEFEGTLEEYQKLFGQAGPWSPSVEIPKEVADHIVETALSEAKRQAVIKPFRIMNGGQSPVRVSARLVPESARPVPAAPLPFGSAPREEPPPELTMTVSDEKRQAAWEEFCRFTKFWADSWVEEPGLDDEYETPKETGHAGRTSELGAGPHALAILVMAYELRSLQKLVYLALKAIGDSRAPDLDFVNRLTGRMIQLSHVGYPELNGAFHYGTSWRTHILSNGAGQ